MAALTARQRLQPHARPFALTQRWAEGGGLVGWMQMERDLPTSLAKYPCQNSRPKEQWLSLCANLGFFVGRLGFLALVLLGKQHRKKTREP